jgi:hypothetical protein
MGHRKRRGQVLIMVGVVLSLLILSVALSIYTSEVQYQEFARNKYNTAVLNFSDDFNRVLTGILAGATASYNNSADITTPRASAVTNFTNWVAAVENAYTLYGLQNNLNTTFFLTNSSIGNTRLYTDNELVKMFWYAPNAISAISAGYTFNLTGRGLYGINSSQLIYLNTTVNTKIIYSGNPVIPITLINNQPSSISLPFQQMIIFNASRYSQYLSSDLGNIRFYLDSNLTQPLHAWLESGASRYSQNSIIWVNITAPKNVKFTTSLTIYMTFLPVGTEFDGNYFGEAPYLSATYGQYDNGPKVFPYYQNFNGTKLPSSITAKSVGGSYSQNNGLTITGSQGKGYSFTMKTSSSGIVEVGVASSKGMSNSVGWVPQSNFSKVTYSSKLYNNVYYVVPNSGYTYGCNSINPTNGLVIVANSNKNYSAACNFNFFPRDLGLGWDQTALYAISNLTKTTIVSDSRYRFPSAYPFFGAASNSSTGSTLIDYARVRSLPPNGVMPTVSFGSMTTPSSTNETLYNILVFKEGNLPVDDLTTRNFAIAIFNPATQMWQKVHIDQIKNVGGGNYTLYVSLPGKLPLPSPYFNYSIVWVTDNRGIMTESYTYTSIQYVLNETAIGKKFYSLTNQSSEVYTLETLSNGTVLWFGKPLRFTGNAFAEPIPIPPVKQLRVYTNTTGTFQLTPSQTEVWTPNYTYPTLNFANWRTRFEIGDKLVYFVSFANTKGKLVAVNITWLSDADAGPPQYLLNIQTSSGFVSINNSVYTLRLLNNVRLSLSIDYSISMVFNGYHIESELSAVGWIKSAGWEPYMLPGGDWNDSTATSFIIEGPVRAVAFRSSSNDTFFVYNSNTNQFGEVYNATGPLYHTDIILVPYNVPYAEIFESYRWAPWNSPSGIGSLMNLITLISGVSTNNTLLPLDPTLRPTNWAYQDSSSNVQSGAYLNPFSYPHGGFITSTKNMGLWFTQYNNTLGEAVIGGDGFNSTIKTINPNQAEFYIWNSYDGDRNAFWAAQLTPWSSSGMSIQPIQESYSAALWVYNGFTGSNISNIPPNIYYRMFLSNYFPTIISSTMSR